MPSLQALGIEFDTDAASDLRRRPARDLAERVVACAEWLRPADRALVRAVYADGKSVAELARITDTDPRPLRRRLRRLVARLSSPEFAFVALARESWAPTTRRVATSCVLEGRSLREASRDLGVSLHVVRRHRERVRTLFSATTADVGTLTGAGSPRTHPGHRTARTSAAREEGARWRPRLIV